jgi:hypothetical protein
MQHQMWVRARARLISGYFYWMLHNIKCQIPCPLQHTVWGRKRKIMCSAVRAEVKFAVWQWRVTVGNCMTLVSLKLNNSCNTIYGRWWQNITWRFMSSETKCCVAWQRVTGVWGSNLLQNVNKYLMTEIASHPRRNVSPSIQIWGSPILKYHVFRSCTGITYIYKETITRIVDTNLSFHYRIYHRSDLTKVYNVCQSNTEGDVGKIQS